MRRTIGFSAALAAAVLLVGCTTASETRKEQASTLKLSAPDKAPTPGERPALTDKKPEKPLKIAIIAIENNPFFAQVRTGYDAVKPKIEALGGKVDWINAGTEVNVDNVGRAINAAVVDGYDAIASLMPGDGICSYIRQATGQGVLVAAYNGDTTCAKESGAVFFHGQDLRGVGEDAAKLMCEATKGVASKDKPGKVGVETESFAFQALEERRLGFLDSLKKNCPWVTPVGDGVEYQGSTDRVASATRDFLTSTPNLVGVYVTGGNPHVAARTVASAGKAKAVKVIGFDLTKENVEQIKAGNLYGAIDQDPYGQSYDSITWLYNALITGEAPSPDYFVPTKALVGTADNIASLASGK
ncbi:sugar ABC transporter substrate-binding protein [Streptomyces albipurpureus]|uniref:Sugar ABC transporter substrate-binding protein n=1 Tax=Streptomyces albipurpureus TaxID=2897419 RepID=A0ABT0UGN4_9ACTN|nr:sugar ABC transporter substrate-binding protein [Streptomyces sp. CWNU-1]MCM2387603.1 sugar ABC transporter substrate-binding protein [Streptomyces sp. CWNU-1]